MKRRKMTKLAISVLAIGFCAVAAGFIAKGNSNNSFDTARKASATTLNSNSGGAGGMLGEGDYYSTISDSLTGSSLLTALNTLNNSKRKKTIGYDNMRYKFNLTDVADGSNGKIVSFYDNSLIGPNWDSGSTWNREHVWPNSRGAGNNGGLSSPTIDADMHMVRPASTSINSERGNLFYGTASNTYDPGQYVAEYRGIAARIIFYCAIADTRLTLVDKDTDSSSNHTMGRLSKLLEWNLQYLPSTSSTANLALKAEQNRNEVIYSNSTLQGNRNPFIDHPEYACKIWGNTNSTTKQICGMSNTSTVAVDKPNTAVEVGKTTTVAATSSNGGTITWSKNNNNVNISATSVASGSSITITGVTAGSAILTARNADGVTATCTVTVAAQLGEPITLNYTTLNMNVGDKVDLIANTNDLSQVTYGFEANAYKILDFFDTKLTVASGEAFSITAVKDGTTTITVSSTNGGTATCVVTIGKGNTDVDPNKKSNGINLPLVLGLSIGGGTILIAGLIVLIVLLVKKKPV